MSSSPKAEFEVKFRQTIVYRNIFFFTFRLKNARWQEPIKRESIQEDSPLEIHWKETTRHQSIESQWGQASKKNPLERPH